ncbi:uncharacterized protein [Canis lupus baileyi]|uniref:uncharacterized protein n=1 Tax=Canis lupus baileyi TaxID=143281 RepID=UPI003B97BDD9
MGAPAPDRLSQIRQWEGKRSPLDKEHHGKPTAQRSAISSESGSGWRLPGAVTAVAEAGPWPSCGAHCPQAPSGAGPQLGRASLPSGTPPASILRGPGQSPGDSRARPRGPPLHPLLAQQAVSKAALTTCWTVCLVGSAHHLPFCTRSNLPGLLLLLPGSGVSPLTWTGTPCGPGAGFAPLCPFPALEGSFGVPLDALPRTSPSPTAPSLATADHGALRVPRRGSAAVLSARTPAPRPRRPVLGHVGSQRQSPWGCVPPQSSGVRSSRDPRRRAAWQGARGLGTASSSRGRAARGWGPPSRCALRGWRVWDGSPQNPPVVRVGAGGAESQHLGCTRASPRPPGPEASGGHSTSPGAGRRRPAGLPGALLGWSAPRGREPVGRGPGTEQQPRLCLTLGAGRAGGPRKLLTCQCRGQVVLRHLG